MLGASRSPLRNNLMQTGKRLARSWERTFDRSIGRQVFVRVHQALGGRLRFLVSGGSALGSELSAVLAGANRIAVETDTGDWEVIGFAEAELVSPGIYNLRRLLRGLDNRLGGRHIGRKRLRRR